MKRKHLPKGIVITSVALSTMLLTTGCYDSYDEIVEEIINDYDPAAQEEVEVYGPMPLPEENQDESDTEIPEEENIPEENRDDYKPAEPEEEPVPAYGSLPLLEEEDICCVYGPPEMYN